MKIPEREFPNSDMTENSDGDVLRVWRMFGICMEDESLSLK